MTKMCEVFLFFYKANHTRMGCILQNIVFHTSHSASSLSSALSS
jgi:hypothetical protein